MLSRVAEQVDGVVMVTVDVLCALPDGSRCGVEVCPLAALHAVHPGQCHASALQLAPLSPLALDLARPLQTLAEAL